MNQSSICAALSLTAVLALGACASTTTVQLLPSPQPPMCRSTGHALVLWATQWRPDQKDVPEREAAAAAGIAEFFATSGCFASATVRRLAQAPSPAVATELEQAGSHHETAVVIVVRELGPIIKIGSSAALVEGGTEAVLELTEYSLPAMSAQRSFSVTWRNGGPGVVKGVASLPRDIQAALAAGMQPAAK